MVSYSILLKGAPKWPSVKQVNWMHNVPKSAYTQVLIHRVGSDVGNPCSLQSTGLELSLSLTRPLSIICGLEGSHLKWELIITSGRVQSDQPHLLYLLKLQADSSSSRPHC